MKNDIEEWGNSVTAKLDGTSPPRIGARPHGPSRRPMKEIGLTTLQLHSRVSNKSKFSFPRPSMVGSVPQPTCLAELVDSRGC